MKKVKDLIDECNNEVDLADLEYLEAMQPIKPKHDNLKQKKLQDFKK